MTEENITTDPQSSEHEDRADVDVDVDELEAPQKRERSTIRFPYVDLAGAEQIAQAVHDNYGLGSCGLDQLAAELQSTTASSTFRQKLAGAGTFGLVRVRQQRVQLTDLGRRIVDPETQNSARAEAFLQVPLYRAIYDRYRGVKLPPDAGLESEMVGLGVSPKQAERARQVLQRSAQYAGFSRQGRDRLVQPAMAEGIGIAPPPPPPPPQPPPEERPPADTDFLSQLHPIIAGLVRMLPREDDKWSPEEQKSWLNVAKVNFAFLYGGTTSAAAGTEDDDEEPPF